MSIKSFYHSIKSILSRLYSMSYIIYLIFYILYFISYILCLVFYVLYFISYILCLIFYVLYFMSCILCLVSCIYIFVNSVHFFCYTLHKYIIRYCKPSISNNNKSRCQGQKHTTLINVDCFDIRAHTSTLCFYSC